MPQKTNLNVSPYFDDFDEAKNYHKVLFKPGYPIQARELTTLQSVLQNQIERFGNHIFKEGSVVIPGNLTYKNNLNAVILEDSYNGYSSEIYLPYLINKKIKGETSGITATIDSYISTTQSEIGKTTIYVQYLNSDSISNSQSKFFDGERILIDEDVPLNDQFEILGSSLKRGEGIGFTISENSTAIGSAVFVENGVYFIRGNFVSVFKDVLYLNQYSNSPTYKVGFKIYEKLITSYDDPSLNDNAQGFSNYAAPGADRFEIFPQLYKIPIDSSDVEDFIQLLEVRDGRLISSITYPQYNVVSQEFARRTYDESGDYFVISPNITAKETLNDLKGNGGIFYESQLTYNNNVPSETRGTYKISPLKAYVKGYEVETISTAFLDFPKTRTTKLLENQSINYFTGPTFTLNRVYGSPIIGLSTTYTVSLRDSRVGSSQTTAPGNEIGLARVYDFALESGSYNTSNLNQNQWDITLFDIQTYTNIELNEPISLSVPTQIKGTQSGATGYLRSDVSNNRNLVVYSSQGNFSIGEKLSFDGIENSRITTSIKSYGTGDIKSLYGTVGTAYTFTADTLQSTLIDVGQVSITPQSSGISTVSSSNFIFVGVASTGNLVSFSNPGLSTVTYAKIESIQTNIITISGITTVIGICDGSLPNSIINPSDFKILTTNLQPSVDNTLYTPLPKTNVSSVDLTNSNLNIRRQFNVTITSNSTGAINTPNDNETFLPFDEERYILIRQDGLTESLSSDKFVFTNGSKTLTINGLGSNGNAKLIATVRKINVKSKIKTKNRVKTIIVNKSKYSASGVGSTTLNDGLSYGNYPYGTRVQDEEICLLEPDVTKIYGIYESNDTNDPDLPSVVLTSLSGPTNKVGDLLVGEEFVGKNSQAVAILAEKINDFKLTFSYLNSNKFVEGEEISFKESGITAYISSIDFGDSNITNSFNFDTNQKNTIYDYSKLIRNKNAKEPTRKIKVVFESAGFTSSDSGDIITANSYDQFDYCDIGYINGNKNTDILDIRPRVSSVSPTENSRSPFEFLGREFFSSENSSINVLASDESILLSYYFYLPRIDKIYLTKNGIFQLNIGVPSEIPQEPISTDDSLEIATIFLPPYLCNAEDANISIAKHKRYTMFDISKLEDRIKNLEYYTSLSLLESDTSNLLIQDSNGLNRFKSGFFVDDFSSTQTQQKLTIVKNSIDIQNSELRPTHYTTSIDLLLGTNSLVGIGTSVNPLADAKTDTNLIGSGLKRTGQLITLDYEEESFIVQPFATNNTTIISSPASDYFGGTIELFPSSDVWVDQLKVQPKTTEAGNYTQTVAQLVAQGFDPQTGYGPVTWGSWETTWTGSNTKTSISAPKSYINTSKSPRPGLIYNSFARTSVYEKVDLVTKVDSVTKTGTSTRNGTRKIFKEDVSSPSSSGSQIVGSEIVPYIRSRNIEFTSKRLKPFTKVYAFFDGSDVNNYITPKLIEISMISGVFQVGETVSAISGTQLDGSYVVYDKIPVKFRVAKQNHKDGDYLNPSSIYTQNPYAQDNTSIIPSSYSSTSTILNVDTFSLANQVQGTYYGFIIKGMRLRGEISGAEAFVTNVQLITDNVGEVIGCFYIPDGTIGNGLSFQSGTKVFRLTNSSTNTQDINLVTTSAEEKYFSEGKLNLVQENFVLTRNIRLENKDETESKQVSQTNNYVSFKSSVSNIQIPEENTFNVYKNELFEKSLIDPNNQKIYDGYSTGYFLSDGTTVTKGTINQNAGGDLSETYTNGALPVIGVAGLSRALAEGYSLASIQRWVNSTGAIVSEDAQSLGLNPPE